MIAHRKSHGSSIFLVTLIIGIILCVVMLGMSFNYLLLIRAQAQYKADAMALSLASKLNAFDRIGEINQLEEASREMIFTSRENASASEGEKSPELYSLCNRLLQDARSAHVAVEAERQNQILLSTSGIQDAVIAYNRNRKPDITFAFFGLRVFDPEIVRVEVGRIAKVESNVLFLDRIPDLARFDFARAYYDRTSKYYRSDINATLPEDSDLNFDLASLAPYMGNAATAARNTNQHVFVPYTAIYADGKIGRSLPREIPSAVKLQLAMESILPWDQSKKVPISLVATASTGGASVDSK